MAVGKWLLLPRLGDPWKRGSEALVPELTRQALIDTSMTYGAVQPNREEVEAMYRSAADPAGSFVDVVTE